MTRKQLLTYNLRMDTTPQADVFAAIAHPARRQILDLLAEGDQPVNEIAGHFGISRPAVSQHLRVLLDAGLVAEQRHGRERRYHLMAERLDVVSAWLAHYQRFWERHLQSLTHHLATEDDQ